MGYYEGEISSLNTGCNNNGWNDWSWIVALALIGGIFGNGGFGFGGGNRNNCCGTPATQADLANGFAQNTIQRGIDDIILGQAQAINYNNQGFAGLQNTLTTSFANLNTNLCSLGYNQAQLVNGLSRELADCCCTTQRSIDSVKYENAKNTCDIIRAGQDNTRAILDYLTGEKIAGLQAENAGLKAQISNDRQSAYLLSELKEYPKAAYIVPNPNCCYNYGVTGFGYSNGCGASVL